MMVIKNANDSREYFSGGDCEWKNMLFELFDHPIHKELSKC